MQILKNSVELWQMNHPGAHYLDGAPLNDKIDKEDLWDLIQSEFNFMMVTEQDSTTYHYRVLQFFKIHKYNFDKLVDSQHFDYDPIDNFRWKQVTTADTSTQNRYTNNKDGNSEMVNLVSAFNDIPSPSGNTYNDTEKERDKNTYGENQNGNNSGTVDFDETVTRTGHSEKSFQELIEEERKLALFNIYHFIANAFAKELLVGVW